LLSRLIRLVISVNFRLKLTTVIYKEMAENTDDTNTITRQALGRAAFLGDLYDAKTDRFCGINLFKAKPEPAAIQKQDNPYSDISFVISSNTDEKLNILDLKGELKLSVLAGMVELGGAAKYLTDKKDSFKSVESVLVCKVTTVVEKLDILRDDVKACISEDALKHPTATHVVVQIDWGANYTIQVTHRNSDNKEKKEVEGCLNAHLQKFMSLKVEGKLELTEQDRKSWENFSLKIFGDVLPDELPTTVDGAMEMMKKLSKLIQKSNDGKGKPLLYVMLPLSSPAFPNNAGINTTKNCAIQKIDEGQIVRSIQIYDRVLEFIQKAHDQVEEMTRRRSCVTESERKEALSVAETLKVQEASFRSELEKTVIAVRSGNNDSSAIPDLCTKNDIKANETFEKCEKIFNAMHSRIKSEDHRKGRQLLHKDVTKELEAKDNLQPFKVRCPGSDCGSEELLWTCVKCNETVQFCPHDRALYCSCGHAMVDQVLFRCDSERHGTDFTDFRDDNLQQASSTYDSTRIK